MVAGGGGPLGGDELSLDVAVAAGARLRVGSAAATVLQPSVVGLETCLQITADVSDDAFLEWEPEPTVVAADANLTMQTTIRASPSASVVWREVVALGRYGETGGTITTSMTIDADQPVLRQSTMLGCAAPAGWDGPAVLGSARVLGTLVVLGSARDACSERVAAARVPGVERVALQLESGGLLVCALGRSTLDVVRALDHVHSAAVAPTSTSCQRSARPSH